MGKFSGTDGVGLAWYSRECYAAAMAVMVDSDKLHRTFEEWLKAANNAVRFVEREGGKPVRVEINANAFKVYCAANGLNLDAQGRQRFASDPANWPSTSKH